MIQVTQQINDVRRTVGDRHLEAGEAKVVTISQAYDTGIEDLWEAVTSAERIPRWFLPITGELREGGRYQLEGHAGGTISRCERPTGFAATWEYNNEVSWIEVRLTPEGDGRTRLQLEHVAHVTAELWERYGPGATGLGWELCLWGLANHLTDPTTALDPKDGPAWMASPEGREFMRLSADAWARAAVAGGDDPEAARAAAERTYAAYTGA
ncbi:SRPBCC family protein [Couchioplanes azureus]|uniref:SRPBCC family protein n=1 Tax=Couchioplanes caeruleus TaxID=56438 RepID=UPI00166F838F|nr:SRPBCC family protein [Couchioplanes caeruleus]GGQ59784.1 activator of HSP90 ATPase [Couchioplanes caeruleus subsp. azureus]